MCEECHSRYIMELACKVFVLIEGTTVHFVCESLVVLRHDARCQMNSSSRSSLPFQVDLVLNGAVRRLDTQNSLRSPSHCHHVILERW